MSIKTVIPTVKKNKESVHDVRHSRNTDSNDADKKIVPWLLNVDKMYVSMFKKRIDKMFRAAEMGLPTDLRKLINGKYCIAQDKCGRTVLHRAILRKTKQVIKFLVENYTSIIDMQDNVSLVEMSDIA